MQTVRSGRRWYRSIWPAAWRHHRASDQFCPISAVITLPSGGRSPSRYSGQGWVQMGVHGGVRSWRSLPHTLPAGRKCCQARAGRAASHHLHHLRPPPAAVLLIVLAVCHPPPLEWFWKLAIRGRRASARSPKPPSWSRRRRASLTKTS